MFYHYMGDSKMMISVHIDDLALYCSSIPEVKHIKVQLHDYIKIKDLGEILKFLGMGGQT